MDMGHYLYHKFYGKTDHEMYDYFKHHGLSELGDDGCIAAQLLLCWKQAAAWRREVGIPIAYDDCFTEEEKHENSNHEL
jgi:hypothetical protein